MLYRESRRIGRTTTLGFLALALVILGQMALSGWTLNRMHREMSETLISLSDLQLESLELKARLAEVRLREKDWLLASDQGERAWKTAETRWHHSLERAFAQIESIRKEDREHTGQVELGVRDIESALNAYAQDARTILAALRPPARLSAAQANEQLASAQAVAQGLAAELDRIVGDAESHEQIAVARLAEQRDFLLRSLLGIGALSLLVSITLTIAIGHASLRISRSLEHQALHDTLTQLLNRRGLAASMTADHLRGGALAYIDLDRFKLVNDLCGHTAGDDLLVELSAKIASACARREALIARVGGDEFAVWMGGAKSLDVIRHVAEEIIHLVETHHFVWLGQTMHLGASIGLALARPGDLNRDVIVRADAACRLAKQPGSAKVLVYEEADPTLIRSRQEEQWAARLPQLIRDNRFQLYGQHIVPLGQEDDRAHVEILLRGIDDAGQVIAPAVFLSAAEHFGLVPKLDRWVIEALLASPLRPDCDYAINLSGQTLMDKDYLPRLEILLQESGRARQIVFEITESAAMSRVDTAREYIRRLKALGCRFALDDFGSGFSSFAYLRDLQVDYLKIDGSLVRLLGRNAADTALVQAIVQMAQTLGLKTIAEFVETPEIAAHLTTMGVDFGQGFALHVPEPLAHVLAAIPRREVPRAAA